MGTTRLIRCSLLLGLLLPAVASAVELYRYIDERGTTVLSRQGVPPEHIARGYEVLNEQGRVIRVIPPAPTAEELRRMQQEKARALSDVQLLRLYSTPEDVERARQRKLAELDGLIGVARGNLQSVRTQQGNLQSQAAEHERAGREVPAHLLAQIDNQIAEQTRLKSDIEHYRALREQSNANFDADLDRLKQLTER
ncbi:DUF4124 domain-containing protein [Pseudomonas sp.]|uniref:DUF4124 domain-containing protein n=1 Tax=Pseudomonas sp. TaxID=306 RepID=UPI002BE1F3B6|nr:DUF4124 domain-containing protein [Pseudomonas sp.]HUE91758.1 DUF4124 domain-containing protein [Pseudomonas sp.]